MKSIKIAHISDVHINTPFSGIDEEKAKIRSHEIIEIFEECLKIALSKGTDIIAISGDLFDNASDMHIVKYIIDRLGNCKIPVFIAAGNHDPKSDIYDKVKLPDNVYVFGEKLECIQLDGVRIYGASFAEMVCREPLLKQVSLADDTINILIMHGDIGVGEYNPMDKKIVGQFDYSALGHIHKYSGPAYEGRGVWAYSGVCEPRGFDEEGKGGFVIVELSKGTVKLKRYETSKREYISLTIDVSDCCDNMDIIEKLQGHIKPENIYHIELTGNNGQFAVMPDYIKRNLEICCFDIEVVLSENCNYEALADGYTLRGVFVEKLLKMADGANESDRKKYMRALDIGLEAFEKAGGK